MSDDTSKVDSLASISQGASLYFIGKVLADLLGFLLHLVLSRTLGAGVYGLYAYGRTILGILVNFTNLGSDKSLLKYLPEYEDNRTRQSFFFGIASITSLSGAIIATVTILIFAPIISSYTLNDPAFVDVLRLFAIILMFDTVARVLHSTFRSLERLEYEILSNKISRHTLRLVLVGIAFSLGYSIIGAMVALVTASFLTISIASYLLLTRFDLRPSIPSEHANKEDIYGYYNFSIPLTLNDAGRIITKRVDILMVGFFLSSTAVGVYNIAVLIAMFLTFPLAAFNQLFPPMASRLYSNGKIPELNALYNTVTRWIFTTSLLMAIGAITYRYEILALFGEEFTMGTIVLVLFVVAQLFNCIGGANGYLLMMTEHQYVLVATMWVSGSLNVVLNYVLILEFGFVGAAVATATILALLNVTKTVEIWYLEGLFPYSKEFVKPLVAGGFAMLIMFALGYVLSGIFLLVVGGFAGTATYVVALLLLGIEDDDKKFFNQIIAEKI